MRLERSETKDKTETRECETKTGTETETKNCYETETKNYETKTSLVNLAAFTNCQIAALRFTKCGHKFKVS